MIEGGRGGGSRKGGKGSKRVREGRQREGEPGCCNTENNVIYHI